MTDEIKITRRIALEKYEYYEIQWTTQETNRADEIIDMIEVKVENIRDLTGKANPEISPRNKTKPRDELHITDLTEGDENFNLLGMIIKSIGKHSAGTSDTGGSWERIDMIVEDTSGSIMVVAWGDQTEYFEGLVIDHVIDITGIKILKKYKRQFQAHLGSGSKIVVVK